MSDFMLVIDVYADDRMTSKVTCGDVSLGVEEGKEYETYMELGRPELRVTDRRIKFGIPKTYTGKHAEEFMKW